MSEVQNLLQAVTAKMDKLAARLDAQKLELEEDFEMVKIKYSTTNMLEMLKGSFFDNRSEFNPIDYLEVGSKSLMDTVVGSVVNGKSPFIRLITQTLANLVLKKSSKTFSTTFYKLFSKFTS